MAKRSFALLLCALLVGAALIVQAQDDPPLTDPTVQAAVSTLLAQTQVATEQQATSMAATQIVGAALNAALTATAQAQITPTPTPVVYDVAGLKVASTLAIDVLSGPANSGTYLAPDGEHFAALRGPSFCIYAGTEQQNCIDLEASIGRLESETPRWSPDSRYLVFTEDFFRLLVDPDIWVWDTVENTIADITDDGNSNNLLSAKGLGDIDVIPHWLPDGRILFLRYTRADSEFAPPDVYVINADGSGLEQLGTLSSLDPVAIYQIDVSADHIAFIYFPAGKSSLTGVWISDLDGGNARQIRYIDRSKGLLPASVDLSPDGRYVLVNLQSNFQPSSQPEDSLAQVIDVASGELLLIDPDHFVSGAGWSPEGSALSYIVTDGEGSDANGWYVTGAPGEPGDLLLPGDFALTTSRWQQSIGWGANNAVLLARRNGSDTLLVHLD